MLRYMTDRARPGSVAVYDIRPGNEAGQFLQRRSPHGSISSLKHILKQLRNFSRMSFSSLFVHIQDVLANSISTTVCLTHHHQRSLTIYHASWVPHRVETLLVIHKPSSQLSQLFFNRTIFDGQPRVRSATFVQPL